MAINSQVPHRASRPYAPDDAARPIIYRDTTSGTGVTSPTKNGPERNNSGPFFLWMRANCHSPLSHASAVSPSVSDKAFFCAAFQR
jgi:hypothetical protein